MEAGDMQLCDSVLRKKYCGVGNDGQVPWAKAVFYSHLGCYTDNMLVYQLLWVAHLKNHCCMYTGGYSRSDIEIRYKIRSIQTNQNSLLQCNHKFKVHFTTSCDSVRCELRKAMLQWGAFCEWMLMLRSFVINTCTHFPIALSTL